MNSEVAAMVANGIREKRAILKRIEKLDDYKDAAEFEARVAEKLAERAFLLCDERDISEAVINDEMERGMAWHVLKKVRLIVEREMDDADRS